MSEYIVCVTEEEPAGFHPEGRRGVSVRLSVATEEADDAQARLRIFGVLQAFGAVGFAVLVRAAGVWSELETARVEVVAETADDDLRTAFKTWLTSRALSRRASAAPFFAKAGLAALPDQNGEVASFARTAEDADAHDVILGMASQTAPVPQKLHLAFVLRLTLDAADADAIVVVPLARGAAVNTMPAPDATSGDQVLLAYDQLVPAGGAMIVGCSSTVTKPLEALTTLIDPDTGFVEVKLSDRKAYGVLRRFEARSGSLFNAALAVAEVDWPAVRPGADQRRKEQEAVAFALLTVRRLAWQAVTTLSCALDTILIALAMPGREKRDGALLAPLLTALQKGIADSEVLAGHDLGRADLRAAFRAGLGRLTILQPPGAGDDPRPRQAFVDALSAACGLGAAPDPCGEGSWLRCLLAGYVAYLGAPWMAVAAQGARLALPGRDWDFADPEHRQDFAKALDRRAFAKALERELGRQISDLRHSLTGEDGAEKTILRLLRDGMLEEGFASSTLVLLGLAEDEIKQEVLARYRLAVGQLEQDFSTRLDGADAARRAAGSLLADRLTASPVVRGQVAGSDHLLDAGRMAARVLGWDFWAHRFGVATVASEIDDVFVVLPRPVAAPGQFFAERLLGDSVSMPADDGIGASPPSAIDAIGTEATRMRDSVVASLFSDAARFVPDASPPGLPVQISVDPNTDDEDDADSFAAAFAGLALLIEGRRGWAYANLAEVEVPALPAQGVPQGGRRALDEPAILPLPTTLNDGRRDLFVTYDGRPFATSAFDLSVPGSENTKRSPPFLTMDHPGAPTAGEYLPPLAYATAYRVAVHAVGRSGSLPLDLQSGGMPWRPETEITLPDGDEFRLGLTYSRTTAIGRVSISDAGGTRRIGIVPDGVRPLSADDPRIAVSVGGPPLDLFRNTDGSGAITLPVPGEATVVTLADVRRWGGDASLIVEVMAHADALPDDNGLTEFPVDLDDHRLHAVAVRIEREDEAHASISIRLDDGEPVGGQVAIQDGVASLWLRATVIGRDGAAFGLADPAADATRSGATAGRGLPDNLLLLGGGGDPKAWKPPFDRGAAIDITFPRVSSLDFERWISNPDLRDELFRGVDAAIVNRLRALLLAAEIERGVHPALARLLDRLPDPAVSAIEIEIVPLDGLRDEPGRLAGSGRFPAVRKVIAVPKLSDVLEGQRAFRRLDSHDAPLTQEDRAIGPVLEGIDNAFRLTLKVEAAEFSGGEPWIDKDTWTIRVPTGMTAAVTVRPVVPEHHFDRTDDVPPAIVPGMRQLAVATVEDAEGRPSFLFEGARLQLESMTGPLVEAVDAARPWQTNRSMWIDLVNDLVDHEPAGQARVYDLAVTPPRDPLDTEDTWRWRRLASIDVATQRWRFMGRPIYSWAAPGAARPAPASDPSGASVRVAFDGAFGGFEQEAFEDRDDADAEVQTADLQPFGSRSRLLTIPWELPSATLFRHRFTLRSRHAGALARETDGLCRAWPARPLGGTPGIEVREREWLRVAMLADRARIALTRPQLRALIPLTTSPDQGGGRAPPILAIIQERPFDWGGLADRVAAEIRTVVGYRLEPVMQPDGSIVEVHIPGDVRRQIGPDPRRSYTPLDADRASRAVVVSEGPIGLTFDDSAGRAPAFPNTALVLQPSVLHPRGADDAVPAELEEHFLGVSLSRYLHPDWLTREPETIASFDRCWWAELPDPVVGTELRLVGDAHSLTVLKWEAEGGFIKAVLHASVIDPVVDKPTGTDGRGQTPPAVPLVLCRIPSDVGSRLAILHQPLDTRRASLSIFVVPRTDARHGAGNAPILCAGISWSIPERFSALNFNLAATGAKVTRVAASEATATTWVRTNLDFDAVWASLPGRELTRFEAERMAARLKLAGADATLSFVPQGSSPSHAGVWVRPRQATESSPTHAQRHVAALLSETLSGPGREIERLCSAYVVPTLGVSVKPGPDRVRIAEFEVVAAVLGWASTIDVIPAAQRFGRFDLTAIGFHGGTQHLSFFGRILGSSATLGAFRSLALKLRADSTEPADGLPPIPIAAAATPSAFVLDLTLVSGVCTTLSGHLIDAAGIATPITGIQGADTVLLPDRAQGLILSVEGVPVFSGGTGHEVWLEVGMLASTLEGHGFRGKLDYDWFFGTKPGGSGIAVTAGDLRDLPEAQARVISVSPSIQIGID